MRDRVEVVGGDFFESVPAADVYILKTILHDWNDEQCGRILRNISDAAAPGARVVIIEMLIPPGDDPHVGKRIDLIMMGTHGGKERSPVEYEALLAEADMDVDRVLPMSGYSLIEATVR
jgi:O-methyltransferase